MAIRMANDWRTSPSRSNNKLNSTEQPPWSPPTAGLLKLNTDAVDFKDGSIGLGFVVRNSQGEVMISEAKRQVGRGSSTLLEALALNFSLNIVRDSGLRGIVVGSDSKQLVKAIKKEAEEEPYVMKIVEDISVVAQQVECVSFNFNRRSANGLAHAMAHFGQSVGFEQIWMEEIPPQCNVPFQNDVRRRPMIST